MSDDKVLIFGNGRIVNGVTNVFKNNWRHTLDFYEYCYEIYDPYHSSDKEKGSNGVFSDLSDIDVNNYTIFVIASPTTAHLENLHFVINNYEDKSNIKKIIIEKPLTNELVGDEFLRLIYSVRDKLFINYHRVLVEEFSRIKKLQEEEYLRIYFYFQGGFANNGSHLLSLLFTYLENIKKINVFDETGLIENYSVSEGEEGSVTLDLFLIDVSEFNHSVWDVLFFSENYELRILDGGKRLEFFTYDDSELIQGYKYRALSESIDIDIDRVFLDNFPKILDGVESKSIEVELSINKFLQRVNYDKAS